MTTVHVMLFPALNVLYFYISTFRIMCAVPSMAVLCSPLIPCFRGLLLRYRVNGFETVPIALIITGITFVLHGTCDVFIVIIVNNSLFVQILCNEDFSDVAVRMCIVATFIIVDLHTNFVRIMQMCVNVLSPHQTLHDSLQWCITCGHHTR